jgi:arsenate reductase
MSAIKIYHNPRCSKSRAALNFLEENGHDFEIVEYLTHIPTAPELKGILKKLGITARELLRTGEEAYKENNLKDPNLSEEDLIKHMVKSPKLIERPIIVSKDKATIARPLDNLIEFLG